jgi:deoxyribose-phosphate aldolase
MEKERKFIMEYSKYIDHTLLKADATDDQIIKICLEAKDYNFASVCVNPGYVSLCKKELEGSSIAVCTVIGFPLGATSTASKVFETKQAIKDGADEIDMVINISRLKTQDDEYVLQEIRAIRRACKGHILKVIIETCLLTDEEKVRVCKIAKKAKADFVKTSTGFSKYGATVADVKMMRKAVGKKMGVKASGGIHSSEEFFAMIKAGATRIGASAGVQIMEEISNNGN